MDLSVLAVKSFSFVRSNGRYENTTEQLDTGVSPDFSFQFVKEKEKLRVFPKSL